MSNEHVDLDTLRRFGERRLARQRSYEVGVHLLSCARCRGLLARSTPAARSLFARMFPDAPPSPLAEPDHAAGATPPARDEPPEEADPMRRAAHHHRAFAERAKRERSAAPALAAELEAQPAGRRRWMVDTLPRFRTYGLAELLLEHCRSRWSADPTGAEELAELALAVAETLDPDRYQERALNDLKAEGWSYVANCRRIRSDLPRVARAFDVAERFLEQGSRDPLEEAALLDLRASYLIDQRRFRAAGKTLRRVIRLYREAGDPHRHGRALMNLARLRRETGRLREAISTLEQAARLIDLPTEPLLGFQIEKNLAVFLLEDDRPEEAARRLPHVRALADEVADRPERLRLLWTEGLIYHGLGRTEAALEAFESARSGFLELGIAYDAALVSLDLALGAVEAGDGERVRRLAREMVPLFAARGIHREAVAALTLFQQAAQADAVTAKLVRDIAAYLREARDSPALRYRPPE